MDTDWKMIKLNDTEILWEGDRNFGGGYEYAFVLFTLGFWQSF